MIRSLKERFFTRFPLGMFDAPASPRLSENAMWLLEQRYFVPRYDAKIQTLRKEKSFE